MTGVEMPLVIRQQPTSFSKDEDPRGPDNLGRSLE